MCGIRRDAAKKAMLNIHVGLAADMDFREFFCAVNEEIQCNYDGTIGRVLEWDNAESSRRILNGVEDI